MLLTKQSSSNGIEAVLWDMDGTLLHTETLSDRAIFEALQVDHGIRNRLDHRLPWDIKEPTLGKRGDEWVPMVIDYALKHWEVRDPPHWKELWEQQESILNSYCHQVDECRGAAAVVKQLATEAAVPMAIATSSRMVSVNKKRTRHEAIFQHMQTIVAGEDVENGKPAPDIYLEAAKRMQVDPANCLVFEDSVAGCKAGKAAGCSVIAVPDSRCDPSVFDGIADQVLRDLTHFDPKEWGLLN